MDFEKVQQSERDAVDDFEKQIVHTIGNIYDQKEKGGEWIASVLCRLENYFSDDVLTREKAVDLLKKLSHISNEEEFIQKFQEFFAPIIFLIKENRGERFIHINDVLSYGMGENDKTIHIHVVPDVQEIRKAGRLGIKKFKSQFFEGLQQLASVVKENERIKIVNATSKMVKNNPKFIKEMEFKDTGIISEDLWLAHFTQEKRGDIHNAQLDRESFLKKYLNSNE